MAHRHPGRPFDVCGREWRKDMIIAKGEAGTISTLQEAQ